MKRYLPLFLVLVSQLAIAEENFSIGPWRIGDTRSQVISHAELGPYNPVSVTGGLETTRAKFSGQPATVSFVFDAANRLQYIQAWVYEGSSFQKAKDAALGVYDLFAKDLGGASIPGVVTNGSTMLDRRALEIALDRVLGSARSLGEKFRKSDSLVVTTTLDLVPKNQPGDCKVVAQLGYSSRHDIFYVLVFQDRNDWPDRRSKSMMFVEKL
jgi:hypothetical protein